MAVGWAGVIIGCPLSLLVLVAETRRTSDAPVACPGVLVLRLLNKRSVERRRLLALGFAYMRHLSGGGGGDDGVLLLLCWLASNSLSPLSTRCTGRRFLLAVRRKIETVETVTRIFQPQY